MKSARILNRAAAVPLPTFSIPEDRTFHLVRPGEFPGIVEQSDGTEIPVVQVIDDASIGEMLNNFRAAKAKPGFAGLLVDRDHLSQSQENTTEAEGWIENLEKRDDGLHAQIRLSDLGESSLKGGRYRFISGVWDVKPIGQRDFTPGCRVRPFMLTEAGLTNRPNVKQCLPLSNRETNLPDVPANSPAEQADIQNRKKETMKQIATKLGLSADASEDAILGEIAKITNRAETAEAALKPVKDELTTVKNRIVKIDEDSADEVLKTAGIKKDDPTYDSIRTMLISNREAGTALIAKIKPTSQQQQPARITNRETAKNPAEKTEDKPSASDEARAARVRNRARQLQNNAGGKMQWQAAWNAAEAEELVEAK